MSAKIIDLFSGKQISSSPPPLSGTFTHALEALAGALFTLIDATEASADDQHKDMVLLALDHLLEAAACMGEAARCAPTDERVKESLALKINIDALTAMVRVKLGG